MLVLTPLFQARTIHRKHVIHVVASALAMLLAVGCAAAPVKRPSAPLVAGDPAWPDDVKKDAERADRVCGATESQSLYDYQEGKEQQEGFKTILGSITGGVGTVGGVIGGVGGVVIKDPDTLKKMAGVTGFITGGLGAVGSVITAVVSPGKSKMVNASQKLQTIDQKKEAARAALSKDPASWSDADKQAWTKAESDLEASCK
jgi:hypothetical protein